MRRCVSSGRRRAPGAARQKADRESRCAASGWRPGGGVYGRQGRKKIE